MKFPVTSLKTNHWEKNTLSFFLKKQENRTKIQNLSKIFSLELRPKLNFCRTEAKAEASSEAGASFVH